VVADACEEIALVGERIDVEPLAGHDKVGQHGGGPSPVVAAQKHPVFSTSRHSAQAALGAGMPTSGLCRVISSPMGIQRESAASIVTAAA